MGRWLCDKWTCRMWRCFCHTRPVGIRPAFYYYDDEVAVVASERPAIQTTFNLTKDNVHELEPGQALIVKKTGKFHYRKSSKKEKSQPVLLNAFISQEDRITIFIANEKTGRITYTPNIRRYRQRFRQHCFSFIPNTAEVAFFGMMEALENILTGKSTTHCRERCFAQ